MAHEIYVSICEYVTVHGDGTHTLVRGGIEHWQIADVPDDKSLFVFAHVPAGALAPGKYPFSVRLVTPSGLTLVRVDGEATSAEQGSSHRIISPIRATFPEFGEFAVEVRVGELVGSAKLDVRRTG
jgi:uncharacterized protein DUF6941